MTNYSFNEADMNERGTSLITIRKRYQLHERKRYQLDNYINCEFVRPEINLYCQGENPGIMLGIGC